MAAAKAKDAATRSKADVIRMCFAAYKSKDRKTVEGLLSDDFHFTSPYDDEIDRAAYFERCWPNAGRIAAFRFDRLLEAGDEVVVTYECETTEGKRFRNTEVLTFTGDKIRKVEVYFGWNLE